MCENHSTIWPILKYFSSDKYINLKFLASTPLKSTCICSAYVSAPVLLMCLHLPVHRVHLAGVHLAGVHLAGVHLAGVHPLAVHPLAVHLAGVHLAGVHL